MDKNKIYRSYIGLGFYDCKTHGVILRNVLENPEWYTPYTPYQSEISQGRLQSLLNFQTMVCDMTGMNFANASLLDESTACAEAMAFCVKHSKLKKNNNFFISNDLFPQNISVMKTRAESLDINIIVGDPFTYDFASNPVAGVIFQYPNINGEIKYHKELVESLKEKDILTVKK